MEMVLWWGGWQVVGGSVSHMGMPFVFVLSRACSLLTLTTPSVAPWVILIWQLFSSVPWQEPKPGTCVS